MYQNNWIKKNDGWLLLILLIGFILLTSAFLISIIGFEAFWRLWNISPLEPVFFDMRNLTGGYESIKAGHDPLYNNPFDPAHRPMNHPRIVQHIMYWLGYGRHYTSHIAFTVIAAFFIGVILAFRNIDKKTALIITFVLFSPAVVLGLERGNHDLFVFFLVCIAIFLSRHILLSVPILLLASFVKLFPIFGSVYLLRFSKNKFLISFLITIAIFIIYLILNRADLGQIMSSTQKGGSLSYGVQVIITQIGAHHKDRAIYTYIPMVAMLITTIAFFFNSETFRHRTNVNQNHIDTFRIGASIYIGTFMLGTMWDYRLMFLLFTIPQLVQWISLNQLRFISVIALISVIISCWITYFNTRLSSFYAIDELANHMLLITLVYLCLCSLPSWAYDLFTQKNRKLTK